MQNLALKIAGLAKENGLFAVEHNSVFAQAADLAIYQGLVKFYASTDEHLIVSAVK